MSSNSTLLNIVGIDLGDYSCRGLSCNLEPIAQSKQLRRNLRGRMTDFSVDQFKQYKADIACDDQEAPELVDVWPGKEVTVTLLSQLTGPEPFTISMVVMDWKVSRKEWNATTTWSISLEQLEP